MGLDAISTGAQLPQMPIPENVPPSESVFGDPAAREANRRTRLQFYASLGSMDGLSGQFLDYVKERLGLTGDIDVAYKPLEEREIREIMTDAQHQVVSGQFQVMEAVQSAVSHEIESLGEKASFNAVIRELESILPNEALSLASRMAFEIFREEVKAYLANVHDVLAVEARLTGDSASLQDIFGRLSVQLIDLVRRAATEPEFDYMGAFRETTRTFWKTANVPPRVSQAMLALSNVLGIAMKLCVKASRARMEGRLEDIRQAKEELQAKIAEASEKVEELKEILTKALEQHQLSVEVIAEEGETGTEDLRDLIQKLIVGFEKRLERLRGYEI